MKSSFAKHEGGFCLGWNHWSAAAPGCPSDTSPPTSLTYATWDSTALQQSCASSICTPPPTPASLSHHLRTVGSDSSASYSNRRLVEERPGGGRGSGKDLLCSHCLLFSSIPVVFLTHEHKMRSRCSGCSSAAAEGLTPQWWTSPLLCCSSTGGGLERMKDLIIKHLTASDAAWVMRCRGEIDL